MVYLVWTIDKGEREVSNDHIYDSMGLAIEKAMVMTRNTIDYFENCDTSDQVNVGQMFNEAYESYVNDHDSIFCVETEYDWSIFIMPINVETE